VIGQQSSGPWLAQALVEMAERMADSGRLPATVGILAPKAAAALSATCKTAGLAAE
jgi:hypothetical protein